MQIKDFQSLTKAQQDLIGAAEDVRETAYNPYSRYFVGAALRTTYGTIISASNMEDVCYSAVHAEVAVLAKATSMGLRRFEAIAISTRGADFDTVEPPAPCGGCRQKIYEFSEISGIDIEVLSATTRRERVLVCTISELLPLPFGPRSIGIKMES